VAPPEHVTLHCNPAGHTISAAEEPEPPWAPVPLALDGPPAVSSGCTAATGAFDAELFEPAAVPVEADGRSKPDELDKGPHPADAERPKAAATPTAEKKCDLIVETSGLWSASWPR